MLEAAAPHSVTGFESADQHLRLFADFVDACGVLYKDEGIGTAGGLYDGGDFEFAIGPGICVVKLENAASLGPSGNQARVRGPWSSDG